MPTPAEPINMNESNPNESDPMPENEDIPEEDVFNEMFGHANHQVIMFLFVFTSSFISL